MNAILLKLLVDQIAIVFRAHQNAGLPPPTSDQVLAALAYDVDKGIKIGEDWLAAHPKG